MSSLDERLNAILERVTADDFLCGRGLGNEVPFYAFDYPPSEELRVREHVRFLETAIPKRRPDVKVAVVNLFELLVEMLKDRGRFDKDRKSTRLNSSHVKISYAVFCLKKKNKVLQ